MNRRGIVLAGGANSRLYPATLAAAKSLLPVYDKPLIYYPVAALMTAKIADMLIIAAPPHIDAHRRLLGNGGQWGVRFSYLPQKQPRGIADAFIIGANFIGDSPSALALADNIHFGNGTAEMLHRATKRTKGATVLAHKVSDPERFGVAEFAADGKTIVSLEEKPRRPKSSFAVTGLYFYDEKVCEMAASLRPSARGELEITDINRGYLQRGELTAEKTPPNAKWFDAGTPESMADAADTIRQTQKAQKTILCAPEESAFNNDWISRRELHHLAAALGETEYAAHLRRIADEK